MRNANRINRLKAWLLGDKNTSTLAANEVNKALIDDSPRVVRITLWAILGLSLIHISEPTRP